MTISIVNWSATFDSEHLLVANQTWQHAFVSLPTTFGSKHLGSSVHYNLFTCFFYPGRVKLSMCSWFSHYPILDIVIVDMNRSHAWYSHWHAVDMNRCLTWSHHWYRVDMDRYYKIFILCIARKIGLTVIFLVYIKVNLLEPMINPDPSILCFAWTARVKHEQCRFK